MCSGDRYPDLVRAFEDPVQGTMDTTLWDEEQIQVSRHLFLILVMLTEDAALRIVQAVHDSNGAEALRLMCRRCNLLTQERMLATLNEVLHVDLLTDERTYMDNVVQWKQRIHEFETMSRETLPDVVKRAINTERSPPAIRTHLLVNAQTLTRCVTVRAAIEAFLAVGRKGRQDQSGPAPMDVVAMTRKGKGKRGKSKGKGKGGKDKEKGHSKSNDTEKEKGARFEGYCGNCGKWRHRPKDCWSKHGNQVNSVETDTADPQEANPPSEQTPVPAAALTRFVPLGLLDDQWNEGWIMTISKLSSCPAQHELSEWTEIIADPCRRTRARRVVLRTADGASVVRDHVKRARLRTEKGEKVMIDFRSANVTHPILSVSGMSKRGIQAVQLWKTMMSMTVRL